MSTRYRAWLAELQKIAATPALVVGVVLAVVLTPLTALVVLARADSVTSLTAVRVGLSAAALPVVVFALWGAYAVTAEYERGAIVTSLLAVPHRFALYGGKLAAVTAVAAAAALVSGVVAVLTAALAAPPPGLAIGPVWAVPAFALIVGAGAALGAAAGFIFRGSLSTASALLLLLLGLPALGPALGAAQPWVLAAGPAGLVARAAGADRGDPTVSGPVATTVFLIVVLVVGLAGWRTFARSDH